MYRRLTRYFCIVKNFLKKMLNVKDNTAYSLCSFVLKEINGSLDLPKNTELNSESRIHEYRKTIKRCRSLLWLFKQCTDEGDYIRIDEKLSIVAGNMGERRDATVNLRTFINLTQIHGSFLPENVRKHIINTLTDNLNEAYSAHNNYPLKAESVFLDILKTIRTDLITMDISSCKRSDFINAIDKAYYKAAQLYYDSRNILDTEVIHKWRKSTKRLLFQLKFTPGIDRILMEHTITKIEKITNLLGQDHDLAILENILETRAGLTKEDFQKIHLVVIKDRARLQKESFRMGEEIFSEQYVRNFRIKSYT